MPSVFTFNRSDQEILRELLDIFSACRGTAREQWSMQAESVIEPVGWDALWKLSKEFCKKFEVRFPCVACVTVNSVAFDTLTASIDVLSVQHETVRLPETVDDVSLIELWPTVNQREQCVDASSTAEFIDLLRFYYNNIWMPWDDQDGKVLLPKTIEERMNLWSDLHNGTIPNCIARSILLLRNSAVTAHEQLKELDCTICEGETIDDDDSLLSPNYIYLYAEISAKLDAIMSKWTMYEDPLIRTQYLAKAKNKWQKRKNVVALWKGGSVFQFDEIAKFVKSYVKNDNEFSMMVSAEEALALEPVEVIVCSKEYEIPEIPLSQITVSSFKGSTLKSTDMRSCLLMLGEECQIKDLTLSCQLVNTVIVMRAGTLHLKSCILLDNSTTSQCDFAQGVVAMAGAKVYIEDCKFKNFYSGIVVHKGAKIELNNCLIEDCGVGVQMYCGSNVIMNNTTIRNCAEQSIRCEIDIETEKEYSQIEGLEVSPNCMIGEGDLLKEVVLVKQEASIM